MSGTPTQPPSGPMQSLARAIAGAPEAPTPVPPTPPAAQFARGQVDSINADGTLQVFINGAATSVTCDRLAHVVVVAGSVVELHIFGTRMVVDGALAVTNVSPGALGFVPIGSAVPFFGTSVPTNWLFMDGSTFSGATYPTLAAVLGSTTLPDARGRAIVGVGSVGTNSQPTLALGDVGGEQNHLLSTAEMPGHIHTAVSGTESVAHAHLNDTRDDVYQHASGSGGGGAALGAVSSTLRAANILSSNQTALHTHVVTIGSAGGGMAHNIMQPYLAANWIIRAA